jgi:hypothetical protein
MAQTIKSQAPKKYFVEKLPAELQEPAGRFGALGRALRNP